MLAAVSSFATKRTAVFVLAARGHGPAANFKERETEFWASNANDPDESGDPLL